MADRPGQNSEALGLVNKLSSIFGWLRVKKLKLLKSYRRYLPMPRLVEGELFLYYTVQANPDKLPNHRLDTDSEAPPVRRTVR